MHTYSLKVVTYSGMSIPMGEDMDREEVRSKIQRIKRNARRYGQPYSYLGNGEWEFETPEDAASISDHDGWLIVRAHR